MAAVLKEIEDIIKYFDIFEIEHVKRANNSVAHELAVLGLSMAIGRHLHLACPDSIKPINNKELAALMAQMFPLLFYSLV